MACPNCHSTEGVDGLSDIQIVDGVAWHTIVCQLCNAQWVDNYTLVNYSDLEVGE